MRINGITRPNTYSKANLRPLVSICAVFVATPPNCKPHSERGTSSSPQYTTNPKQYTLSCEESQFSTTLRRICVLSKHRRRRRISLGYSLYAELKFIRLTTSVGVAQYLGEVVDCLF